MLPQSAMLCTLPALLLGLLPALLAAQEAAEVDPAQEVLDRMREVNAVQSVYLERVPHTDAQGRLLTQYDPARSFFPLGVWGSAVPGDYYNYRSDWAVLRAAGFNTVWPWAGRLDALEAAEQHGLQVVHMGALSPEDLERVAGHPRLLANVWRDEPALHPAETSAALLEEFTAYREMVRRTAPDLPVFANLVPWIMPPALTWWVRWAQAGDLSCHDNYPVMDRSGRAASLGADPNGIPQSVALAVAATGERKPVWLIVGAFTLPPAYGQAFPFRYPCPRQLRACVYAGLIHGATGIIYFAEDSYITRDGSVIGMSPHPQVAYTPYPHQEGYPHPTAATPLQLIQARALWETAAQINAEIAELTPSLLSPTVGSAAVPYAVTITGRAPTETPVRALLKPHPEGGWVLLTVNVDDAVLRVVYDFPQGLGEAQVLFENRLPLALEEEGTRFALDYEPFDTHVLRLRPAPQ